MRTDPNGQQPILSQEEIVKLQMVEALPRETSQTEGAKFNIPDMSYGWYNTSSGKETEY